MALTFSYKIIQSKIEGLNFPLFIKYRIEDRKSNVNDLEKKLETGRGFLYNTFKKYDPLVSILVTMSIELQYNLFEPFLSLLPEPIRQTRKEKQL